MPFTVSHAAVVLPVQGLLRRWHLLSAAVIGSMAPDFGLVLPPGLALPRGQTHGIAALFTFCLPVGLAAWWLFQLLIKPGVQQVLPDRWYVHFSQRHPSQSIRNWRCWLGAALAIVLGAITHLVLDGFTHENGRGTLLIPVLDTRVVQVLGHAMPAWRFMQYLLSVIGLLLLGWALCRWWLRTPVPAQPPLRPIGARERRLWIAAYCVLPVLSLLRGAIMVSWVVRRFGLSEIFSGRSLAILAVESLEGSVAALLVVSALILARLADVPAGADAGRQR